MGFMITLLQYSSCFNRHLLIATVEERFDRHLSQSQFHSYEYCILHFFFVCSTRYNQLTFWHMLQGVDLHVGRLCASPVDSLDKNGLVSVVGPRVYEPMDGLYSVGVPR